LQAYRIETTLQKDGTLILHHLPFQAGESIEIIILARSPEVQPSSRYPLRGASVQYNEPTEPVAQLDWEAIE
jgi:hypothetical protein